MEPKAGSLKGMIKLINLLLGSPRRKRKTLMKIIRSETDDAVEEQRILRNHCKHLYADTMDNLEEMNKLLESHKLPRLNLEETGSLNRSISSTGTRTVIKKYSSEQKPGSVGLTQNIQLLNTFLKSISNSQVRKGENTQK